MRSLCISGACAVPSASTSTDVSESVITTMRLPVGVRRPNTKMMTIHSARNPYVKFGLIYAEFTKKRPTKVAQAVPCNATTSMPTEISYTEALISFYRKP